ncbi:LuxR family transcriptional regulator [Trinickia sp. NRRL B-1857]|uniref:helix-turn-helix transcriptional regulator n=1 Tax=Trinickia sp. NRRL B-1857 TaxID=3162879 RepID=UPI003D2787C5
MDVSLSTWWNDVSTGFSHAISEDQILQQIRHYAKRLGFESVAFGTKGTVSPMECGTNIISNYPEAWVKRYLERDYVSLDPVVRQGMRTRDPVVWHDALFVKSRELWSEAQDFGLRAGLSQSSWARGGIFTILSVARDREPVIAGEAGELQPYLFILAECVTAKIQNSIDGENARRYMQRLSPREIEILKWSADGKTSLEISSQLGIASATVHFHLQNAKRKLGVATKIQAMDHARRLGVLD